MAYYIDPKESGKWRFNFEDFKKWSKNTLIFSSPLILAVLGTLQMGGNWEMVKGAVIQAVFASAIDFFRKLKAGE